MRTLANNFAWILLSCLLSVNGIAQGIETSYENEWKIEHLNTARTVSYMKPIEKAMILELNMVRSDPKRYAESLEEELVKAKRILDRFGRGSAHYALSTLYTTDANGVETMKIDTIWHYSNEEDYLAIKTLIDTLKNMDPMPILQPHKGIYAAATKHAKDQAQTGDVDHRGTDGSWPTERILAKAPDMFDGNENIAAKFKSGEDVSAKEIVIQLLIDTGIPGYGHRYNILDKRWTHTGCVYAGYIGGMHYFVQNFGAQKKR